MNLNRKTAKTFGMMHKIIFRTVHTTHAQTTFQPVSAGLIRRLADEEGDYEMQPKQTSYKLSHQYKKPNTWAYLVTLQETKFST